MSPAQSAGFAVFSIWYDSASSDQQRRARTEEAARKWACNYDQPVIDLSREIEVPW